MKYFRKILRNLTRIGILIFLSYPRFVKCNICLWAGRCFIDDEWHPRSICPRCKSQVRHRLLFAALTLIPEFSLEKNIKDKRVLHFAPEKILSDILRKSTARYTTADYLEKNVDKNLDISNIDIPNASFDVLIACDVLEHVADDKKALMEIYRVLNDDGMAILTVPQKDLLPHTFEDSTVTSPVDRVRIFGQWDHLRIYGDDFQSILEMNGFKVTAINEKWFDQKIVRKYVLFPPALSKRDLATNYRKVFFAKKLTKTKVFN